MRVAVCDDNAADLAAYSEQIRRCAEKCGETVEIQTFASGQQLLFALSDARDAADVVFIDINMPQLNGISAVQQLRAAGYTKDVVFLTVSTSHFLSAFDVGAFNYIVKGQTTDARFEQVVAEVLSSARRKASAYMLFSAGGENISVPVSEIMYFEVKGRIIEVHYGKKKFDFFSTLGKLENKLRNYGFIRIHRGILAAKTYIRSFSYDTAVLANGEKLPVSRNNYALLKDEMREFAK